MSGYDQIGLEIIQVFLLKLLINMVLKYRSTNEGHRRDAFNSAKLIALLSSQFFDKNKTHYKQVDASLCEVLLWVNKQKDMSDQTLTQEEILNYSSMF